MISEKSVQQTNVGVQTSWDTNACGGHQEFDAHIVINESGEGNSARLHVLIVGCNVDCMMMETEVVGEWERQGFVLALQSLVAHLRGEVFCDDSDEVPLDEDGVV